MAWGGESRALTCAGVRVEREAGGAGQSVTSHRRAWQVAQRAWSRWEVDWAMQVVGYVEPTEMVAMAQRVGTATRVEALAAAAEEGEVASALAPSRRRMRSILLTAADPAICIGCTRRPQNWSVRRRRRRSLESRWPLCTRVDVWGAVSQSVALGCEGMVIGMGW